MSPYEKVSERLLRGQSKAKPYGKLVGNRFLTGTKSLHWAKQSRMWHTFWRLKFRRMANRIAKLDE